MLHEQILRANIGISDELRKHTELLTAILDELRILNSKITSGSSGSTKADELMTSVMTFLKGAQNGK